jgi:hypothetical protein
LVFFPGRLYFDFDFDVEKAIEMKGEKVNEHIRILYTRTKSEGYTNFAFLIKSKSAEGFTLYELGRAIHKVEKYTDLNNHNDGNTCVYEINITNDLKDYSNIDVDMIKKRMEKYNARFMSYSSNS